MQLITAGPKFEQEGIWPMGTEPVVWQGVAKQGGHVREELRDLC